MSDAAGDARKQNCRRDLFHLTYAPQRNALQHPIFKLRVFEERRGKRRLQERRRHRIDANILRRKLHAHRLRKPFDGVLGHAIDRPAHRSDVSHLRGDVHDGAAHFAALGQFHHLAGSGLRHHEHGANVEIEHRVQMLERDVDKRFRNVYPRVVDKDIQTRQPRNRFAHAAAVGHIADESRCLSAARLNARHHLVEIRTGSAHHHHFGAGARQRAGSRRTDAAAATGHQRSQAVQPKFARKPVSSTHNCHFSLHAPSRRTQQAVILTSRSTRCHPDEAKDLLFCGCPIQRTFR